MSNLRRNILSTAEKTLHGKEEIKSAKEKHVAVVKAIAETGTLAIPGMTGNYLRDRILGMR